MLLGDWKRCCGSHRDHSVLSTTVFAVPVELILGNWLFLYPHDLLRGVALFTVAGLEGRSSPAEFQLQALTHHSHNLSLLLPSGLACSTRFVQQRETEPAAGACGPGQGFPCLCIHHLGRCWTTVDTSLTHCQLLGHGPLHQRLSCSLPGYPPVLTARRAHESRSLHWGLIPGLL